MRHFRLLFLALGLVAIMSSCGEDCDKTTFDEIIIGTWNTTKIGDAEAGKVTFNSDGTGSSTENSLFSAGLNGETSDDFTWSYDDSTMDMSVKWEFGSTGSLGVEYEVRTFDCEEVTMNYFLNFTISK